MSRTGTSTVERAAKHIEKALKRYSTDGVVDHKEFLKYCDSVAAAQGHKLTPAEYGSLGRMAAAWENARKVRS